MHNTWAMLSCLHDLDPCFSENKGFQLIKLDAHPCASSQESRSWSRSNLAVLDGTSCSQNSSSSSFSRICLYWCGISVRSMIYRQLTLPRRSVASCGIDLQRNVRSKTLSRSWGSHYRNRRDRWSRVAVLEAMSTGASFSRICLYWCDTSVRSMIYRQQTLP